MTHHPERRHPPTLAALLVGCALLLGGCSGGGQADSPGGSASAAKARSAGERNAVAARPLAGSLACPREQESAAVAWIDDDERLRQVYAAMGVPPRGDDALRRRLDMGRGGAVWVQMGQRPTGGYGLSLPEAPAHLTDGVLTLRVRFEQPGPNAMVTQVVTSPCLLVAVDGRGFGRIRVVDEDGQVRADAAVPPHG